MSEQSTLTNDEIDRLLFECQIDGGAAFEQLWSLVSDPAYRWLLRRVKNIELAKLLLQDTALKLLSRLHKRPHPLAPIHCFKSYGVGVARNAYRRYCSEQKRQRRLRYRSLSDVVEHTELTSKPMLQHRQWQEAMETREILRAIPKRDRSLIYQRYFAGCSCEAIANRVGRSERQIQNLLAQARNRIRRKS